MMLSGTIVQLTKRLSEFPDDPNRYAERSLAYFHLGQVEMALSDMETAISLAPHESEYFLLRGQMHFDSLRFDLALTDIRRAIELDPQERRPYYYRGLLMPHTGGNIEQARNDIRRGTGSPDSDPEHHYGMAALAQFEGDYPAALEHAEAALAIGTTIEHNVQEARAKALAGLHRIAESYAAYDRAIEMNPESAKLRLSKAALTCDMAEWTDAVRLCDSALAMEPNSTEACHIRTHALMNMGKQEEALSTLQDGLVRNPGSEELWRARADAYMEMRRSDDAIETWTEMSKRTGLNGLARIEQARVHAGSGRPEEAMRLLDEVADEIEADHREEAYLARAVVRLEQGDIEAAMGDFAHVVEYGDGDAARVASIAGAQLRLRMEDEEYSLHDALVGDDPLSKEEDPEGPAALVERAERLYMEEGQEDQARRMIRRALELDPDNEEALSLMIQTLGLSALDLENTKAELDWMIRTHPSFAGSYDMLSHILHKQDRSEEAIELATRGIEVDPHHASLRVTTAGIHLDLDDYEPALEHANAAISIGEPGCRSIALLQRAEIRQYTGEHEGAVSDADSYLRTQSDSIPVEEAKALEIKGRSLMALKKYLEAVEAFDKVLEEKPGDGFIIGEMGMCHLAAGDYELAWRMAGVLAEEGAMFAYYELVGEIHMVDENFGPAVSAYQAAIFEAPTNSRNFVRLAEACYALGKNQKAVRAIERAIELDPNDSDPRLLLASWSAEMSS